MRHRTSRRCDACNRDDRFGRRASRPDRRDERRIAVRCRPLRQSPPSARLPIVPVCHAETDGQGAVTLVTPSPHGILRTRIDERGPGRRHGLRLIAASVLAPPSRGRVRAGDLAGDITDTRADVMPRSRRSGRELRSDTRLVEAPVHPVRRGRDRRAGVGDGRRPAECDGEPPRSARRPAGSACGSSTWSPVWRSHEVRDRP